MRRREFLAMAGVAASLPLATPAIARPSKTILFVPQANLTSLEPHGQPPTTTRNCLINVMDTLYGVDVAFKPSPQMAAGAVFEDDGKRCTITLRDNLTFHDGTPVLARDCAASLKRWMVRDSEGQTLASRLDALEAPDDRTLVFRLNKKLPDLLYIIGNPSSPAFIMPERLAATDPFKPVPELVGSGPLRFNKSEYVSGSLVVLDTFKGYVPRSEPADYTAGGRRMLVDRVEWRIIPDASTAVNALVAGEVDWVEYPLPDLFPVLRNDSRVVLKQLDPNGLYPCMRLNCLQGPTANPAIRRAILAAVNQREVMEAIMGQTSSGYRLTGAFLPGSPAASDAAMDRLGGHGKPGDVAAMLEQAGYGGEKLVIMHPTDQSFYNAMSSVVTDQLRRVGFAIDDQTMDWGTVVQRRSSKEPLDKGGWSLFPTSYPGGDFRSPLTAYPMRGNGMAAWYGWPTDATMETLREKWLDSDDAATRKQISADMQVEAFTNVPNVPLGNLLPSAAWRRNLTGLLPGMTPVFWNVEKQ